MMTFEASITINRPVDVVVKALMNADNFPYWQTDLERFEVIEGKPGEVGSIGHLHYSQKGKSYVMEDKMVYCEPGKRYVSEVSGDAINARVETNLQKKGKRTKMTVSWSGNGKSLFLRLLLPFFRGKMIKQSNEELKTFKKLIETRGPDFSKK